MPLIAYGPQQKFHAASVRLIDTCNEHLEDFTAQGYEVNLRQLYYRLVSRDVIQNNQKSYKRLVALVSNARLAGMIDWHHIVDLTRYLRGMQHWNSPADIVRGAAASFRVDRWRDHKHHVEIWVEKDALSGIIARVAQENDVPYFSCRGYTSQSEMWGAAMRLKSYIRRGIEPIIIHLGDHDPSGIDMTRDIEGRLEMFLEQPVNLTRIALNMDQIEKYKPPPNPAKTTDSRFQAYIKRFGHESWELDALDPADLHKLIATEIAQYKESTPWQAAETEEVIGRALLDKTVKRWNDVTSFFDMEMTPAQIVDKFHADENALDAAKTEAGKATALATELQTEIGKVTNECSVRGKHIDNLVQEKTVLSGIVSSKAQEIDALIERAKQTGDEIIRLSKTNATLTTRVQQLEKRK